MHNNSSKTYFYKLQHNNSVKFYTLPYVVGVCTKFHMIVKILVRRRRNIFIRDINYDKRYNFKFSKHISFIKAATFKYNSWVK